MKHSKLPSIFRCLAAALLLAPLLAHAAEATPPSTINTTGITFPTQAELGNIFVTGEKVQIQAAVTTGSSVDWTITDYLGQKVASGTAPVTDGNVTITPDSLGLGFYLVHLTAKTATATSEGLTSCAVIPALDNTQMADTRFGVASHFGKNMTTDLAPLLAKAGIAHVRDSMDWSWVESKPGVFDFTVHDFVNRMADLQKNHITPLITAVFGNDLHFDDPKVPSWAAAPHTPEQYAAYTQLCLAHLKQFGAQIQALEIWNEYNGSFCKGPAAKDRPKYYTEMLKDAYTGIKAVRPDVQVIGGALNNIPLPYCEKLFQDGALNYMDGIAVHPYAPTPENVGTNIRQLVDLMKKYNHGIAKPIWVTEFSTWKDPSIERASAAAYLTRMSTAMLAQPEVERIYWYLARDYDEFTVEGLVHKENDPMGKYTPTANYVAFATVVNQLHHANPHGRLSTDPRTDVYSFARNGQGLWVCWSNSQTGTLVFQTAAPLRLVNLVGAEQQLTPVNGQITLQVTDQPVYVVADNAAAVTAVHETPRADQVLADSATDFSNTQGQTDWSYHWCANNADGSAPYDPDQVEPMKWTSSPGDWFYAWAGPSEWFQVTETGASPAAQDHNQLWAIRRWTSPIAGLIHVVADLKRENPHGDGVGCKLFRDGREIYTQLIPPAGQAHLDLPLAVIKGSRLDLILTPGPGTDTNFDSTAFHIRILTQPQP